METTRTLYRYVVTNVCGELDVHFVLAGMSYFFTKRRIH